MKRVLTALVLIPLVLLAVLRAPDWLFTLLVGVVAVLATIEYLQIAAKYGYRVYPVVTVGCVAGLFGALSIAFAKIDLSYGTNGDALEGAIAFGAIAIVFAPSMLLAFSMRNHELRDSLPGAALSFFALPYVGFAMLCVALLRMEPDGWFFVLFMFFAVWVGDTAAYYVGRSIGKTKFASRISPKKTWEGAIASVIAAMIVGIVFARFGPRLAYFAGDRPYYELKNGAIWAAAVAALLINVAAQLGDLFESLIKRGADVKDSGTLLPGHGGILDRIDALLFAAPVALVVFLVLKWSFIVFTGDHGG